MTYIRYIISVQKYIDNSGMAKNGTWGTDVEMLCFSHILKLMCMFLMLVVTFGLFLAQLTLKGDYHASIIS